VKERRVPESPLLETIFRVGQVVPTSGVYQLEHSQHRLPEEITLPGAQHFPPCASCKFEVNFKFLRAIQIDGFTYTLNAIPILPELGSNGDAFLPDTAVD
jgi:hypothetical protein